MKISFVFISDEVIQLTVQIDFYQLIWNHVYKSKSIWERATGLHLLSLHFQHRN